MQTSHLLGLLALVALLSSCGVYKQHILFRDDGSVSVEQLKLQTRAAEDLYLLQPYDQFTMEVYTGSGERIVDPEFELLQDMGVGNQVQGRPNPTYIIQPDSTARLPMIGVIQLGGLTQQQAELAIQKAFLEFYEDTYALITLQNRRVVVLGAPGGQVIPLANEGMTVLEVLALAGGIPNDGRAHNIRLIRPPFDNAQVQIMDLTTLGGMQQAQLRMQPGDVLYVEPRPQALRNGLREVGPLLNALSTSVTLVIVVLNLLNNG